MYLRSDGVPLLSKLMNLSMATEYGVAQKGPLAGSTFQL